MDNDIERKKVEIKGQLDEYELSKRKTIFTIAGLVAAGVGAAVIGQSLGMPEGMGEYVTMAVESAISMGVVVSSGTLRSINDKLKELKDKESTLNDEHNKSI